MAEIIAQLNTLTWPGAIGLAALCALSGWLAYLMQK